MRNVVLKECIKKITIDQKEYKYYSLKVFSGLFDIEINKVPYFIRIILEMVLRKNDRIADPQELYELLLNSNKNNKNDSIIPFFPSRVLLQDYTGIPLIADLAAMRDYVKSLGKNPRIINPMIPTALVIDHSVISEFHSHNKAIEINMKNEFERNKERYKFIKWGATAFSNFTVIPPGNGIVHQINLEFLAPGVHLDKGYIYPDSLVGTDSHTTMVNSIGTVGWGVGGIEAESVLLGQPIFINLPEVIGVRLNKKLKPGVMATDLALNITNFLRQKNVVGKVIEFFGEGVNYLSVQDRATVSNMAPEYGALTGLFSVDKLTLEYFKNIGKSVNQLKLIENYYKEQGLFNINHNLIEYNEIYEIDLSLVENCVAGPTKPEEKLLLNEVKDSLKRIEEQDNLKNKKISNTSSSSKKLNTGDIVIAAITSCTNTANPNVIIAAALLAKNALVKGLTCPSHVLKIFAPGSKVVKEYLKKSGLLKYLEELGFYISAYGCAACVGNIGELNKEIEESIIKNNLVVTSVLSGNRNFESRVHSLVKANYLMSPPLVVAYSLVGNIKIDLTKEPLGYDKINNPIFLQDLWPTEDEINFYSLYTNESTNYTKSYSANSLSNKLWDNLYIEKTDTYNWDDTSTYIKKPPFFDNENLMTRVININHARALLVLEDSITTDHISPAGKILPSSVASKYLVEHGENYYNTYGTRRGNHEVMVRGTFSNPQLNNLISSKKGGVTKYFPNGHLDDLHTVAEKYKLQNVSTIILAGYRYGAGSSRDWAAKGTKLLGVKAVIAKSFERIHRSNLLYMGVLPCQFANPETILLDKYTGNIKFNLINQNDNLKPNMCLYLEVYDSKENLIDSIPIVIRLDNDFEVNCYLKGGILFLTAEHVIHKNGN